MTDLRNLFAEVKRGQTTLTDIAETIADAGVFVGSGSLHDDELNGYQPIIERRCDIPHVAVFTSAQTPAPYAERAPYGRVVQIRTLAQSLDPTHGVIIDPGEPHEACLSPEFLGRLRRDA